MMLANELLEKGQRGVVLEYFQLSGKFWRSDRGQLARWTEQVKAGEIPQFGANLVGLTRRATRPRCGNCLKPNRLDGCANHSNSCSNRVTAS